MSLVRFALVLIAAGSVLATTSPAGAAAPAPRLSLEEAVIRADGEHAWQIPMRVVNPLPHGLYMDSLRFDVECTDAWIPATRRKWVENGDVALRAFQNVAAEDSSELLWSGPAVTEHGRVGVRLYAHGAPGSHYLLTGTFAVDGGVLADNYPSRQLPVPGGTAEIVAAPATGADDAKPGLLLIAGEDTGARERLRLVDYWAKHGYNVIALSLPGVGASPGKRDLAGPSSVASAGAALDELLRMPNARPASAGVVGEAEGATVALLLATQRPEVKAVVALAGSYDLRASATHGGKAAMTRAVAVAGRDSAAWKARSPLASAAKVKADVLIVHGEKDLVYPVAGARAMAAALEAAGDRVLTRWVPTGGHVLLLRDTQRQAKEFLKASLGR